MDTMVNMKAKLWSRLPSEIVERALTFVSVPVLCRFRTVCKRWNSLNCEPAFEALCIRHAREADACFLVARYAIRNKLESKGIDYGVFGENHGWSFLDLNAKRWYTIKHDEEEVFDCFKYGTVAMDGGLVCQFLDADDEDVSMFVSNPIAKTSRRLQAAPCYSTTGYYSGTVNMVVNTSAQNYKIFLMPNGEDYEVSYEAPPPMVVYEWTTDRWQSTSRIPMSPSGDDCCIQCSAFSDGLLYVLMCCNGWRGATDYWLWSYNHVEDAWEDTCVNIPLAELINPQLIVSDNRLFFATWLRITDGNRPSSWSYEVREVLLADQTHSMVIQIPGNEVMEVFDILPDYIARSLHAIGFCKSIILMCKPSGVSKMYDLSTCSWVWLPKNPVVPLPEGRCWADAGCWLDYGKPMNLILPASALWVNEPEASTQSI